MASNIKYNARSAVTITLASLAASSSLTAGRVGTQIDNSTNLYDDYLVSGFFKAGTSPTAGTLEVWAIPETDDTTRPNSLSATDAAYTATTRDILTAEAVLLWSVATDTTTGEIYYMRPTSVAACFGGVCPRKFSIFVTHSMVAALDSTGANHEVVVGGIQETIV